MNGLGIPMKSIQPAGAGAIKSAYVLDDEPHIGSFVCEALRRDGLDCRSFSAPFEFLAATKLGAPDLVVVDLALGQSDAIDVMRKLEAIKYAGRVLLISGHGGSTLADSEKIGLARGLRMLPSLQKPFRAAQLKEHIARDPLQRETTAADIDADSEEFPRVDLKLALQHNLLDVWYQPKVDLRSFRICGAEALLRIRHPEHGLLLPAAFLPPASDPLYLPLSLFVLRRVTADWVAIAGAAGPLTLSLNVPASVLNAPGFVPMVRPMLPVEPGFPGLLIELAEDDMLRDTHWVREIATQLALLNVHLSIDGFGTAHAWLSRLQEVPCAELKLDRRFVSGCAGNAVNRSLCQTVVELGHRVGAAVCAEGVENAEDLQCLVELGVDVAQGFLFSEALPLKRFIPRVAALNQALSKTDSSDGAGRESA
jgi:EAL domain-containing protein (putative c-di-GMP-specific phosphodiesterase class I)/FixJ family two-component response regulator